MNSDQLKKRRKYLEDKMHELRLEWIQIREQQWFKQRFKK